MFGGASSKLGRGAPNRRSFPPPPAPHRASAPANRPSLGSSGRSAAAASAAAEESFSLISGSNSLAFSMIIRLAPDLVEEIRRVESQGGTARVKFGPNPHNPSGNIIDVGGKEFRFTWSKELGDLCDIYEERRSGEDGNGLLVESGCAWRKLNVQRILDESTKNHVKRRSEEAERKMKSRKAIVLEPGNPSMKSQLKALAAVEATSWKNYNKKKEAALKKRKVETLQVGGPPKSSHRSGLTSTSTTTKGRHPSPLPSPPDPFAAASSSPLGAVNMSKSLDDAVPSQMTGKQDTNVVTEKEIPTRTSSGMRNTPGVKGHYGSKPVDLQGLLISLLKDKPNGMTLKALEKAVGDTLPNSIKKIEPIIKKIAKYQAPGRYILRPPVDLENLNKPQNESGSSPDDNHSQVPASEEFHDQTSAPLGGSEEKVPNVDLEELVNVKYKVEEESNNLERIDAQHTSPDILGDKRCSDHSEGQAASSSDSGSDSDSESDSSDSGSDSGSHSRSRSRSPAGTGSGSSSDSESDASSSSKEGLEGSDEDVDIMTSDDEKESNQKAEASDHRMPLPIPVKSPDGRSMQKEVDEKQAGNESDEAVEIEKDLPEEQETGMALPTAIISNRDGKYAEEARPFSPDYQQQLQERQNYIGSLFDERENEVKDSSRHEHSDSSDRLSKGKHKRGSDGKNIDDKSERAKRLKGGNWTHERFSPGMDVPTFENSRNMSPFEFTEDTSKGPNVQVSNRVDRQGNSSVGLQKGPNRGFPGKSGTDLPQIGQRSSDQTPSENPSYPLEKSDKHGESVRHSKKQSGKDFHAREASSVQKDKSHRDTLSEDIHVSDKKVPRNSRDSSNGSKQLPSMDSYYQKQGEMIGKSKEGRPSTQSHLGTSPKDNNRIGLDQSPLTNGQGITLQRELSDLELGELRESTPDETHIAKQFERKGSFKRFENKANASEDRNSDIAKVKPSLKVTSDSTKPSPAFVNSGPSNFDSTNKKNSDNHFEDSTKSRARVMQTHSQHLKTDHAEAGSQNKSAEMSSKFRNNESGMSQDFDLDGRTESNRRAHANATKQPDSRRGVVSYPLKESKKQTPNSVEDMADGGKDSVFADRNHSDQKKRESSSDENSCSYSKYEKDEPELKGPIKTFSQYKDYVQEYRDKYDSYCSLNKILESYRDEFQKLGKELEYAKDRDLDKYYDILEQLKESYRRSGARHKKLKKIFVVLHVELENIKRRIKDFAHSYNK